MMRRLFPHPGLTLSLIGTWLLLVNGFSAGSLVMAGLLGTGIPLLTHAYWPHSPKLNHLPAFLAYICLVIWDILLANIAVARIILFRRADDIQTAFIPIPISLTSPEAIAILSATITLTPGTITADMSACGRMLLIHSLHAPDPDAIRDEIKSRYEARLKRIFG